MRYKGSFYLNRRASQYLGCISRVPTRVWMLYVISLSSISVGPPYTFWNSLTRTSMDYIIGCLQASQFIHSCFTHELSPHNTSDHLTVLQIPVDSRRLHHSLQDQRIDWVKARITRCVGIYQDLLSSVVHPLLGRMYDSPEQIDNEIIFVSLQLVQAARPTLSRKTKKKKWFKDQELSRLASPL